LAVYGKYCQLVLIGFATLFITSCGSSESQLPNAADQKNNGEKLYSQNCVSCHGSSGDLGVGGAANLASSTLSLNEKIDVISKGRNSMQAYSSEHGGNLSPEKIKSIAEYIEESIKVK
jgi:mono/diheme cytochrome c family protein